MKRLIAAEREYEAKRDADPNGYRIPYGWLEMLSHLSYVVLAVIWGVSTISYLKVLDVGWWYCWQVLVPSVTVSTLFILGKPLYEVHNIKHSWRPIIGFLWTLLFSVSGVVVGVTFIIIKIVFVANSDPSDPTTIRATHVGGFVVLICFCCALVVLDAIVTVLVVKLWLRKPHSD